MKYCPGCHDHKPPNQFNKRAASPDGLTSRCKTCINIAAKTYRQKDTVKQRDARRKNTPEYRAAAAARTKQWKQDNPDRAKQTSDDYYRKNKDRIKAYQETYRAENPDKLKKYQADYYQRHKEKKKAWRQSAEYKHRDRLKSARRRAMQIEATVVPFTEARLKERLSYYANKCWICGKPATHIDHVKPLSKGGAHMLCNLRPACGPCNMSKNARWPYTRPTRPANSFRLL